MGLEKGCIQVYTGDGKGKTTAALGQALRAMGHGLTALVIQFMKGNIEYGELEMARRLSPMLKLIQMGRGSFVDRANPDPKDVEMARGALALARRSVAGRAADVIVLDEINVALDFKLIPLDEVLALLDSKPPDMELILTGRSAPAEIIARADLVTEMREVKHYYGDGVKARVGIER